MSATVLKASDVSVHFGGVRALVDVGLDVGDGELVGLIGPNGAGKTTFVDAISGFVRYTGRVELDGTELTGLSPHKRALLGLGRTWQGTELFEDLTVRENLSVASRRPSLWQVTKEMFRGEEAGEGEVEEALDMLELGWSQDSMPADLSQGQRKLVGVARAIVMKPRLLCLDEPAAGLDTGESEELGQRLRALADKGNSMLLIDHDMGFVMSVCDRIFVLEFGKLIADGPPDKVRRDPRVVTAYLGSAAGELAAEAPPGAGE
jgi:branched-chain amino acid transport system ATP-binding protein